MSKKAPQVLKVLKISGQVIIPKSKKDFFALAPGDRVTFSDGRTWVIKNPGIYSISKHYIVRVQS